MHSKSPISDHLQSRWYEEGPRNGAMLVCRTESAMQPLSNPTLVCNSAIDGCGRLRFIHAEVSANACERQNVVSTHRQLHLWVPRSDSGQRRLTNRNKQNADRGTNTQETVEPCQFSPAELVD